MIDPEIYENLVNEIKHMVELTKETLPTVVCNRRYVSRIRKDFPNLHVKSSKFVVGEKAYLVNDAKPKLADPTTGDTL